MKIQTMIRSKMMQKVGGNQGGGYFRRTDLAEERVSFLLSFPHLISRCTQPRLTPFNRVYAVSFSLPSCLA